MRTLSEARELLRWLYGIEFPDGVLLLHEFLAGLGVEERGNYYNALGMTPIGPLQVLTLSDAECERPKPSLPWVLHWRYYRDVPEFFSCLFGDQDRLHWGLLLDDPAKGFRGAASFYENDRSPMRIHQSLFGAVLDRIEEMIDRNQGVARDRGVAPEDIATSRAHLDCLRRLAEKIHKFIKERRIPLDDGRPEGSPSDTGFDVLVDPNRGDVDTSIFLFPGVMTDEGPGRCRYAWGDWSVFRHYQVPKVKVPKEATDINEAVRDAVTASELGRALPALKLGRSLWYWAGWAGGDYTADAYNLLKKAYTLLDRPALLPVLDAHFQHRQEDRSVDLLKGRRTRAVP